MGIYSLHAGSKSQEEAVTLCNSIGEILVEPKSYGTNNEIVALAKFSMTTQGKGVWIGVDDKSVEGSYRYASDGSSAIYANWATGQPNNYNDQDCVLLWDEKEYRWGDEACHSTHASVICERKHGKYTRQVLYGILCGIKNEITIILFSINIKYVIG